MNKISVAGRIVADSELRFTANNDAILNFRLADDVGFGDKKSTNWWQCTVWGKRGESLQQYATKGQQVTVFGQVQLREYTDKDGQKRISTEIRVENLALTGSKSEGAQEQAKPTTRAPNSQKQGASSGGSMDDLNDDVPF